MSSGKAHIDENLLIAWGAVSKKYGRGEIIFEEGQTARSYYQILHGSVRMFNVNRDSKEFTQGMFNAGESFGEPPLFIDKPYPASAIALEDSIILKLPKEVFSEVLKEYPLIHQGFTRVFAERIYGKANTLRALITSNPEERILAFLNHCREKYGEGGNGTRIPFTRQEIANFTGLRVETVIRAITRMNKEGVLEIREHKVYF